MTLFVRASLVSLGLTCLVASWTIARPSPDLLIEAPPNLAAVADEIRVIGNSGDFSGALLMTGLMGFSSPIRVVIAPNDSPVARRTPDWVSGFEKRSPFTSTGVRRNERLASASFPEWRTGNTIVADGLGAKCPSD